MDKPINKVNEPQTGYDKKITVVPEISFFTSIAEQEESHYKWLASLTPEQHLQNALANIKRIYAYKLSQNTKVLKEIIFE